MTETAEQRLSSVSPKMQFVGHRSRYIRRTLIAVLVTLGLVALHAAVYFDRAWAGVYSFAGIWAVVFFALTPLIFRDLLFAGHTLRGLLLLGVKFAWMGLMFGVGVKLSRGSMAPQGFGSALIAGVTTPLAVVLLRELGRLFASRSPQRGKPRRPGQSRLSQIIMESKP